MRTQNKDLGSMYLRNVGNTTHFCRKPTSDSWINSIDYDLHNESEWILPYIEFPHMTVYLRIINKKNVVQ